MDILHFEHIGEAKAFLESEELRNRVVIGKLKTLDNISSITNMGICGALNESLKLNQIVEIGEVLSTHSNEIFKTNSLKTSYKCITSSHPITNSAEKNIYKKIADVVDMELWHIANICFENEIPLYSYKLVSDFADEKLDKKDIIKKSREYSDSLFKFFKDKKY